jgi:polyhydroxybutyrate depolymerase
MPFLPIITAVLLAAISAPPAQAQSAVPVSPSCDLPHASGMSSQRLVSGARQRAYRLFVPAGYDGRTRVPLILDLHGSGGSAADQAANSGFEALSSRERFVVATLEAEGGRWNVPVQNSRADDVAYVGDVIAHLGARVCIDQTRVYATGFSGGGRMTSLLACRLGSRIAAIAPVAGLRFPGPCSGRAVPVLTFHGLADLQNPYDGYAAGRGAEWLESVPEALAGWARHNSCNGELLLDDPAGPLSTLRYDGCADDTEVRMIRIDGLGHSWAKKEVDTTGVMWDFFKRHRLSR